VGLVCAEDKETALAAAIKEHNVRPADRKRLFARPPRDRPRRFPPPWAVDDPDVKLGQECFIIPDANGHALVYCFASWSA
jgi:hypothetical protein